jgi:hypothetical protein
MKAQEQGVARLVRSREELARAAERVIHEAKAAIRALTDAGLIAPIPA